MSCYSDAVDEYLKEHIKHDQDAFNEEFAKWQNEMGIKPDKNKLPWQESDQKAKADAGKPRLSLVPSAIVYAIARIREYGNSKYPEGGKNNWKRVEVDRYRDAAYRHMLAYIDDPTGVDRESGLPHLWHLACNVAFLCELEKFDDEEGESEIDYGYME